MEGHIAWRYLFSKKSHNAINIVSGVSAVAVGVVTAAMVCVLSVMNGFGTVIEQMFSQFDPELRITAKEGKYFDCTTESMAQVKALPYVDIFSRTIEETALVEHDGRQIPAQLKGVDSLYNRLTNIDSILLDGSYCVFDGGFERCVMGIGLANRLSVGAHFVRAVHLYAPRRNHKVNMLRPDESFNRATCFMAGVFAVNQVKYDEHMALVSLNLAQELFEYAPNQVTAIEMKLADGTNMRKAKKEIRQLLGDNYVVQDRYEQQQDFFRILRIEKLLTAILLVFILLIACFNIIGSLTMLMIDKEEDCVILRDLGADNRMIRRVFLYEGWLISALGATVGLVVGVLLCRLQERFEFLRIGNGTEYVISAYPVHVEVWDLAWVLLVVYAIGMLAAWIPTRHLQVGQKK